METKSEDTREIRPVYGKDESFDLQIGMSVFAADGSRVGIVSEVAGFGATDLPGGPGPGEERLVTEAQSGTGYFKVKRSGEPGSQTSELCVPFRGIQAVTAERGVILTTAIRTDVVSGAGVSGATSPAREIRNWRRWLPGARS